MLHALQQRMQNPHQLVPATCTTAYTAAQLDLALRQLLRNMRRKICCRAGGLRPRCMVATTTGTNGADDFGDNCVLSLSCRMISPKTLQRPLAACLLRADSRGGKTRRSQEESVATQYFSHLQLAFCENEAFNDVFSTEFEGSALPTLNPKP